MRYVFPETFEKCTYISVFQTTYITTELIEVLCCYPDFSDICICDWISFFIFIVIDPFYLLYITYQFVKHSISLSSGDRVTTPYNFYSK